MEKDGTGSCTTKPKSEWRTKKSGKRRPYWEEWSTKDDNLSDEEQQRQEKAPMTFRKTTNRNEVTTKDICWFLQKRLVVGEEGEEENIDYKQIEKFTMAIFHVIADLLIDNCVVNLDDLGTLRNRNYRISRTEAFQPHFTPNKDLMKRINQSGDKFIARTYNIGYEIRDEREARQRVAERMHENYIKRKEAQNDESNDEG